MLAALGLPASWHAEPLTLGHIHDSYRVFDPDAARPRQLLLQHINTAIFPQPERLMQNLQRVAPFTAVGDHGRRMCYLTRGELLSCPDDALCWQAADGGWWRACEFLADTYSRLTPDGPAHAEAAAAAFGAFQRNLLALDGPRLYEPLPGFHDTPRRFRDFEQSLADALPDRRAAAAAEISDALRRTALAERLAAAADIPERIAHNDAKLSNLLLDVDSGAPVCVVDLDTVMPGLSLHDFGDLVRSMACAAPEDEPDLSRVHADPQMFAALVRGYRSQADAFLTSGEIERLYDAGCVITFEQGLRFLGDFLTGDRYYRTTRPAHNLERARVQFTLLASLEAQERELRRIATRNP